MLPARCRTCTSPGAGASPWLARQSTGGRPPRLSPNSWMRPQAAAPKLRVTASVSRGRRASTREADRTTMTLDSTPAMTTALAHVTSPSGAVIAIPEGSRLVFGRGPDADLIVPAGRGLSRRAGVISAVAGGAWVANISRTHALYAEGDGYRVRLPRMDETGDETGEWRAVQGLVPAARRRAGRFARDARRGAAAAPGRGGTRRQRQRAREPAAIRPGPTATRPCCRSTSTPTPSSSSSPCCGAGPGLSIPPAAARCRGRQRSRAPRSR